MGLTKQYLRYESCGKFNIIASTNCNVCFVVLQGQEGRFVAVGGCEDVVIWDLRLGEKSVVFSGSKHEVTQLAASPDRLHLAVGYSNGNVNLYNLITGEIDSTFSGHRTAISAFAFDELGHRLATGSKDTEIVIWDIVAETGLERLSGHKGVVTSVSFMKTKNVLISSSKDTYIKLWDLDTWHNFQTIATHVTEVWGLTVAGDDEYIVAGSNDSELRVWELGSEVIVKEENPDKLTADYQATVSTKKVGSILRLGHGRIISMCTDVSGRTLAVHGKDQTVELFNFLTKDEAKVRWKKRQNKEKKKLGEGSNEAQPSSEVSLRDIVKRAPSIKTSGKLKSVHIVKGKGELRVAVILNNNKLELYSVSEKEMKLNSKNYEANCLRRMTNMGHQGEVRALAFSSDSLAIASVGSSCVKIWNRTSLACLRTVDCGYALSVVFVPGDRHALVGMKDGKLLIVDLSAGEVLEEIPAHTSEVWSVVLSPDKSGAFSCGGGDNTIKEWKFELVAMDGSKSKILSLLHTRTLKLDDSVLCMRVSPCGKFIAAGLLDSTVKIFFADSFKFFLSLYGHKLPVLCMDISDDSTLIATGSADRNIKIWGMDFGDCHKSIFAHDDSVTGLAFVPNTHYFFTVGKDGKVKEWDADTFDQIITLDGHLGEGWGLALTSEYVVTCGQDRVLRLFNKTQEPLVLSDEQEEERQKEEEELATGADSAVALPSTKTPSAERGAEMLMECLEEIERYKAELKTGVKPTIPPVMSAYKCKTPSEYLGKMLLSIRPSELGESLLLLPLHSVTSLLELLPELLKNPEHCEPSVRALLLLLKVHHGPLSADQTKLILFSSLQEATLNAITKFRDLVGENLFALHFNQRRIEAEEGIKLFKDASLTHKEKEKRKRKKQRVKMAQIISL